MRAELCCVGPMDGLELDVADDFREPLIWAEQDELTLSSWSEGELLPIEPTPYRRRTFWVKRYPDGRAVLNEGQLILIEEP